MSERRYAIMFCSGCIGINDTQHPEHGKTGPGYHRDDPDVVAFWSGEKDEKDNWYIPDSISAEADRVCDLLNDLHEESAQTPSEDTSRREYLDAINREISVLGMWRQYCHGGPGDEREWDAAIEKEVEWGDIAWSVCERLRKATGRPMPCDFCHGSGRLDIDLGADFEEVECRRCGGTGDGKPWGEE